MIEEKTGGKPEPYLVTGGSGFIGRYLRELFPEANNLDLKEKKDILKCKLPDAQVVIHLAAKTSVLWSIDHPEEDAQTNIIGTIRLAKHYANSRFIFASSGGAIQEKIESPYGLSKFCAEEYIKMICKDAVILRFPNIYGIGSKSVVDKFCEKQDLVIYGDGSSTRDYVHVSDLVRAIKASVTWPPGTYHLGWGKSVSVLELAQATGKRYRFAPRKEGEVWNSVVPNDSPWRPTINVLDYIRRQCMNFQS